jgi:hypothetical protein
VGSQDLLLATPRKRSLEPWCLKESSIRSLKEQKGTIIVGMRKPIMSRRPRKC